MLLKTKFLAPACPTGTVIRDRLFSRLNPRAGRKLALVVAPAGYGKTTLVSHWLSQASDPNHFSWLSLDQQDNDADRFWNYFFGSIQHKLPDVANEAAEIVAKNEGDQVTLAITSLINRIMSEFPLDEVFTIVLDDFHHVDNPKILISLNQLIEYLPPNVQIIVTTRVEPGLSLPAWRVKGLVDEIHAADLAFSDQECQAFFKDVMKLDVDEQEIHQLCSKTEGWVAALQLLAIASGTDRADMAGALLPPSGDDKLINDYVLSEVLNRQPDHVRDFLLDTSCLMRVNTSLCNFVLEIDSAGAILHYLEQHNLFIVPLDKAHNWYRYHDLFRESLSYRQKSIDSERVAEIQTKAIEWYLQHGQLHEAISQVLALEDWERLAELLETHGNKLIHEGAHPSISTWLSYLPIELVEANPKLLMLKIWALFFATKIDIIPPLLERLEDLLDRRVADSHPEAQLAMALHSEISLIRSYVARSKADLKEASALTQRVLEDINNSNIPLKSVTYYGIGLDCYSQGDLQAAFSALESSVKFARSEKSFGTIVSAAGLLGWVLIHQGELEAALQVCLDNQAWVDSFHHDPTQPRIISCWLNSALVEAYREKNQLTAAESYLKPLLRHLETGTEPGQSIIINYVQARLLFAQGDFSTAITCINHAEDIYRHKKDSIVFEPPNLGAFKARCLLSLDEIAKARASLENHTDDYEPANPLHIEQQQIALSHALIASEQFSDARLILDSLIKKTEHRGHFRHHLECLLLLAICSIKVGDIETGNDLLFKTVDKASREGYLRIFAEGPVKQPVSEFLQSMALTGIAETYIHALRNTLSITAESARVNVTPAHTSSDAFVEPISQRELEVLKLINEGLANKEIAQKLSLAPATVKAHIRNIYGKIGAKSRTEAISKARSAGVIE